MANFKNAEPYREISKGRVGRVRHPLYRAWSQMINRCHNPRNTSYQRYGAIGVIVCERWREDFLNFIADVGDRPAGMTLDRIDPKGAYEPGNVRWATAAEQRANISPDRDRKARAAIGKKNSDHWRRKREAKATCLRGHPWTPENIYIKPNGRMLCRICRMSPRARKKVESLNLKPSNRKLKQIESST